MIIAFQYILDNVGMQIYCHLHPKDISSFASCNRHLRNNILNTKQLARICTHLLPLQLGGGTNYLVEFREGHSFSSKEALLNHLLQKTEAANLFIDDTQTTDQSRCMAREVFLQNGLFTAKFRTINITNNEESITGNTTAATLPPQIVTVECCHQSQIEKRSAISWTNYILDRDACRRSKKDRETYRLIRAWLDCLFSRTDDNDTIVFGMWRWACKHRNLTGQGIAGVGIMITVAPTASESDSNTITMEVRLTRMY
mmetsp:Transcript_25331/g.43254  ORF Transcript_25331/g.43254 Transcript_25331/m.43254 type:complete len:256 (-) Transcript_25331:46-813(-)